MMEDKPEKPDLPILSRKAYLTWNEVDGLLFHYAYKRNAHGNYKWQESLKNARKGVRDLFEEALLLSTGELKGESLTRGNTPIYQKIKKGELCAWLMGKRILDLLKDKGIEVLTENVKFIEEAAKEKEEPEPSDHDFPPHQLKDWSQINFCALTEKACLEISVDGEVFSQSELTDNGLSSKNLSLLYNIVQKNGFFDKPAFPNETNLNQSVGRLNKSLRKIFKINQDPISHNKKAKGYEAAF